MAIGEKNRLRRGQAFQGRGAIRRFRKPYNCCPGPGWPLWPLVGKSAQARRGFSRARCHPSLSEIIYNCCPGLGWPLWPLVGKSVQARRGLSRLRRGEAFQGRGAIRRFRKPYNCCPGPGWPLWPLVGKSAEATVAIGEKNRLRRGEAFQGRGAIRRFRKPYNCCPGPGWPLWPLVGKLAQARRGLSRARCHPSLSETI